MIALRKKIRVRQFPVAVLALAMVLGAAGARALTPQDQQEIQSFTLTNDFWQRYTASVADSHAQHLKDDETNNIAALKSLDAMTAEIEKSPEKVALLKKHGLTPREAVVGGLVVMRAAMADAAAKDPRMAKYVDKSKMPSEANMAFYRTHRAEIVAMQKQAEQDEQ